ncbi:FtsK/SpoIIIE domain-containing protein [Nocardioides antri]|uniref:Cell division protein FtsK n=1 Tax=Nocardioides antri TaxID=2607659 RepID=A0A5B1M2S4_9ACTN|nr:FtsK/SpoIIIE domain-containing protein [Nocardioides antri]KAA1427212.1 cell division protein FtsK [Nocardioides antri]
MRFSLSVVNGATGVRQDVLVDADPETEVAELLPRLLDATNGQVHPGFAKQVGVWVDGQPVEGGLSLRDARVRPGSVVALHEPDGYDAALPRGVVEVRVVSGPGAGRIHRFGIGEHQIGNGASGMSLPDLFLPADALLIRVTADADVEIVERDRAVRIDGRDPSAPDPEHDEEDATAVELLPVEALTRREQKRRKRTEKRERKAARKDEKRAAKGAPADAEDEVLEPVAWPEGADLRIGESLLQWHRVWVPDADAAPSEDTLGIDFNRPPRLLRPERESSFVLPAEPVKPRRQTIPWPVVVAPMFMAVPMCLLFGSWRFMAFALLSPVLALFNFIAQRKGAATEYRRQMIEFREDTISVRKRVARAQRLFREDLRRDRPDPARVLLVAVGPGQELWMRRRADPDYLELRLGVADRPSPIKVNDRSLKETDEPPEPETLGDVPVSLSMRDLGVIGLCGETGGVDSLARWLIGQAAVLHAPGDLDIVVLTNTEREQQWGWTRWLPHCRRAGEPVAAVLGTEQQSVSRRLAELGRLIADRAGDERKIKLPGDVTPRPDVLVVVDGARRLRALPGLVTLLREGPAVGVKVICIDEDVRLLPEECRAVLDVHEGLLELRRTGSEAVARIRPDLVEPTWALRVGRALAPVRDTTPSVEISGLPASARLLECISLEHPTPEGVASRWGPDARTDVVIGEGFDGPFRLDLRKDGPHALIAGTTGSGKSELLQTIVASLAVANSPEQLTFVLVDYKGGSAFKDCARLPHTVGMVTDLDTHLVSRALTSLGAELKRREHLLAVPGAKDLEDYWALQRREPGLPTIPRLAIVIDEFASLKAELPDFVTGLVTIAQRGRSLGIHLVLATQRPSGVISNDIRANTNLRIALRVTDESESKDVIDAPDSATIGPDQPGRGYARLGHSSLLPFQAGRVGGARPEAKPVEDVVREPPLVWPVGWDVVGQPAPGRPKEEGKQTDEGETDLSVLVEAINGATRLRGIGPQHSPWLPELPAPVTLPTLRGLLGPDPDAATRVTGWSAPWVLEDHPGDQAQRPREFVLGRSGHLYIAGGARSGRSTALRTLAAGLAEVTRSRDLHLYGLDCGNGALLPLTALPHTGAVVQRTEVERASRLLDRLGDEVKRRQDVLGQSGFADIDEQRQAVRADERLPYVVLLLDRWEGFVSDLSEVDVGRLNDRMLGLLREGASVGIHVVVSGDRSLLSGRVASLVENKLLLRLPDRSDYTSGGLKTKDVPEHLGDGRGLWAESGIEAQVAVLGDDVAGAAQSAFVRELGARLTAEERSEASVPPSQQPFGLAALPSEIDAAPVLAALPTLPRGHVPVGIGGDRLELLGVDAGNTPVLVVGPPSSGRTNTLRFISRWARAEGRQLLAFTPSGNLLSEELGDDALVGIDHTQEDVVGRLRALESGAIILIDDGERLKEGPLAPVMGALVRQARDRGFHVVLGGGVSELSSGFSGWVVEARSGRKGLLLSPQEPLQGDVFGSRVSRTSLVPRVQPGRGVVFPGTGDQIGVQVPLAT